ncbi:MAG: Fic family protein [Candidatus Dormibacteraeota bacterium]|nr:Fic family protein [Candidatus Dormibacteraeota bacterium]
MVREPDDIARLASAIDAISGESDPVAAAARLAFRVARAQAFAEANKRTALLLARWLLDHNDVEGETILPVETGSCRALGQSGFGARRREAIVERLGSRH